MASSSSTTWSRNTSATDRATLIAGSGRPRVSRPIELRALMTRASSLPARPESTVYPIAGTSPLAIHLGGLRQSLVSLWDQYRPQILGVFAALLAQSALISWLIYEHRRRQRGGDTI